MASVQINHCVALHMDIVVLHRNTVSLEVVETGIEETESVPIGQCVALNGDIVVLDHYTVPSSSTCSSSTACAAAHVSGTSC